MAEENDLPQLKELYERLRNDAREVAKDLLMAKHVYQILAIISLVFGAVSLGFGVSSLVLKQIAGLTLFDWALPSMIIAVVIGLVLLILGSILEDKSETLEKKYGADDELKKLTQG
jgi:uncharacterized membrane protein